jgi:UDP-N-acetylmuramoyl-tripeptide--D-alanyl-D-alanine ligase
MEPLTISEVLSAANGNLETGSVDSVVTGISTDTRSIKGGELFFALLGENFDGHDFIPAALKAGAVGVVVSKPVEDRPVTIRVRDTLVALGDLAQYYAGRFKVRSVGITGSVGKTTTKEMTAAVLSRRFRTLKNELNFNNEIGVPMALLQLTPEHEAMVIEMAMRLPREIARLAEIVRPCVGVITNIGMSHIERLGSLEAIAEAKAELLVALPDDGLAVLPADDDFFDFLLDSCSCRAISFGVEASADIQGGEVELDAEGRPSFDIVLPDTPPFRVRLPITGRHNVYNALAAAAVGWNYKISPDDIQAALEGISPPEKRASIARSPRGHVVFDDTYNASPASVSSALQTLEKMAGERKIAVLGDMLELGDFAPEAHKEIGKQAAEIGLALLITVGELAKTIADGAREAGLESIESVENSDEAAEVVDSRVQPGDVVLVKGSRAMKMEKIVDRLVS